MASSGAAVYALDHDGSTHWASPYTDNAIDQMGTTTGTNGLSFAPVPFFSSVVLADIDMGSDPEILFGAKTNVVCLDSSGSLHWAKGATTGYYFATPAVTDIEGNWTGVKSELEVVAASDADNRDCYLEAIEVGGASVFRESVLVGGMGGLVAGAPVTLDMDGSFQKGGIPGPTEETDAEIHIGTYSDGLRIWERRGNQPSGKPKYEERTIGSTGAKFDWTSAAVGNISGNISSEIIIGTGAGFGITWSVWTGALYCYDQWGTEQWSFSTGTAPSGIFSSPAICDVQMEGGIDPTYEIFFGCDNGKFYCLDGDLLTGNMQHRQRRRTGGHCWL